MCDDVVEEVDNLPMRPIPLRRFCWATVPWISEHGIVRNRHYNARLREWFWEKAPLSPVMDKTGRIGHRLQKQFRTITALIALAWLRRRTSMRRMRSVELISPCDGVVAYNLRYKYETDDDEESDAESGDGSEEWTDMECKVGLVPCIGTGVLVSNRGRIRKNNIVSYGVGGLGGQFCILPSIPPIPIERVAAVLFSSQPRGEKPPPRIRNVIALLKAGADKESLQCSLQIKSTTVWSYVQDSMRFVSTKSATTYLRRMLLDKNVEASFRRLVDESPHLLHAPLREIVDVFTRTSMASDPLWRTNPNRYAEVCALRSLIQREC